MPDLITAPFALRRPGRLAAAVMLVAAIVFGGLAVRPASTAAAEPIKVVIVVGPVEGNTAKNIRTAKAYADLARSYGATVVEVYSPKATWSRVKAATKGANVFIYLGHGNGYPSPYGAFSAARRNGMGLNKSSGHGNSNVKYYGETYMKTGLDLASNSVVLLNHLCYASGNSEPGRAKPSKTTAKKRADGYATGFLRAGARAVVANGHGSLTSILTDIFTTDKTVGQMFQDDWAFDGGRDFTFTSVRNPWATVWMDPMTGKRYYHSIVGRLTLTATQIREGS